MKDVLDLLKEIANNLREANLLKIKEGFNEEEKRNYLIIKKAMKEGVEKGSYNTKNLPPELEHIFKTLNNSTFELYSEIAFLEFGVLNKYEGLADFLRGKTDHKEHFKQHLKKIITRANKMLKEAPKTVKNDLVMMKTLKGLIAKMEKAKDAEELFEVLIKFRKTIEEFSFEKPKPKNSKKEIN